MDIRALLQEAEGKTLEFKRDLSSLKPIIKTLVAFANTAGGTLIIGRDDKGGLCGVKDIFAAEEQIANAIEGEIDHKAKILFTYGFGSIKKNGVYDQVVQALAGHDFIEFGGIQPNPQFETLMEAVQVVKEQRIDFLLAVGGGSVIDGTKFIAAASCFEGEPWDILSKHAEIKTALPLGCILTLPATGSEMNGSSVVTKAKTQEKLYFSSVKVNPVFSVLDPETTFSLPANQVGNGIVDAFVHVMEQYLTFPNNTPIQDRFAEGILLTLIEEGPKTLKNPNDYDARANFMWAAANALNGMITCGAPDDWSTHMIGHEITALYGLDHAQTLAIILPAVMTRMKENKKEKLLQYGERVWNITSGNDEERINAAIEKTRDFFESVGVKTHLSDHNLTKDIIPSILDRLKMHKLLSLGEKGDMNENIISDILELSV